MAKRSTTVEPEIQTGEAIIKDLKPGRTLDPIKFQRILDYYNTHEPVDQTLSGVTLYIYRRFPKTDYRKTAGKKNSHILKLEGVTEDGSMNKLPDDIKQFVTDRFGGGRFSVIITDNKREGDSELATATIKVDELKFSPILDTKELVTTDPETSAWITRQVQVGELARDDQGNVCLPGEAAQNGAQGADAAWARVARDAINQNNRGDSPDAHAVKRTVDMVADTATEMMKRMAPKDPVEQFTAMATALKGNDGGGMTVILPLLMTMMQENTKVTLAMMEMIGRNNRAPAPTTDDAQGSVAVVERIMGLVDKVSGKDNWLDQLKSMIPLILPLILARPGAGGPAAAPDIARVMAGVNGDANGAAPAGGPRVVTQREIEDLAAHAWMAMSREQDGSDYANAIDIFFGPETYDSIHAMGKEAVIGAMMSTQTAPRFRSNQAAFLKFVDDFMRYGDEQQAENAPAAGAPGTPPGTPPARPAAAPSTAPAGAV